ncbi:trypsin-like serine protease [Streptomyces sp. NPDC053560]|uniref:trypsin-like serine protease n=1 Tax=Streptomyces sp. NPDC053560 TaxID=3365711 RepID=UPI0037D8DB01
MRSSSRSLRPCPSGAGLGTQFQDPLVDLQGFAGVETDCRRDGALRLWDRPRRGVVPRLRAVDRLRQHPAQLAADSRRPRRLAPQGDSVTHSNDVAILKVTSPLPVGSPDIQAVNPDETGDYEPGGTPTTVSGWGTILPVGSRSEYLHAVTVPVVDKATCNTAYANYGGIDGTGATPASTPASEPCAAGTTPTASNSGPGAHHVPDLPDNRSGPEKRSRSLTAALIPLLSRSDGISYATGLRG